MANRAKKDAAAALANLMTYLRRDIRAIELLDDVQHYLGILRKEKTESNNQYALLSKENEGLKQSYTAATNACEALKLQNEQVLAQNQQLARGATLAEARCQELEEKGNLPDDNEPQDLSVPDNYRILLRVAKQLRKRLNIPPLVAWSKREATIELNSIVKKFTGDEFTTLGMFCAVSTLLGFAIRISANRIIRPDSDKDGDSLKSMVKWMLPWIGMTEVEYFTEEALNNTEGRKFVSMCGKYHKVKASVRKVADQ